MPLASSPIRWSICLTSPTDAQNAARASQPPSPWGNTWRCIQRTSPTSARSAGRALSAEGIWKSTRRSTRARNHIPAASVAKASPPPPTWSSTRRPTPQWCWEINPTGARSVGSASQQLPPWESTRGSIRAKSPTNATCVGRALSANATWRSTSRFTPAESPTPADIATRASITRLHCLATTRPTYRIRCFPRLSPENLCLTARPPSRGCTNKEKSPTCAITVTRASIIPLHFPGTKESTRRERATPALTVAKGSITPLPLPGIKEFTWRANSSSRHSHKRHSPSRSSTAPFPPGRDSQTTPSPNSASCLWRNHTDAPSAEKALTIRPRCRGTIGSM